MLLCGDGTCEEKMRGRRKKVRECASKQGKQNKNEAERRVLREARGVRLLRPNVGPDVYGITAKAYDIARRAPRGACHGPGPAGRIVAASVPVAEVPNRS